MPLAPTLTQLSCCFILGPWFSSWTKSQGITHGWIACGHCYPSALLHIYCIIRCIVTMLPSLWDSWSCSRLSFYGERGWHIISSEKADTPQQEKTIDGPTFAKIIRKSWYSYLISSSLHTTNFISSTGSRLLSTNHRTHTSLSTTSSSLYYGSFYS